MNMKKYFLKNIYGFLFAEFWQKFGSKLIFNEKLNKLSFEIDIKRYVPTLAYNSNTSNMNGLRKLGLTPDEEL